MKRIILLCLALTIALPVLAQEQNTPRPGQVFQLGTNFPKYVTAHVEFRDATGARWPSIFYGRPTGNGAIQFDPTKPAAAFALECDKRPQRNGDQSRRVLGEVFSSTNVAGGVTLRINSMGAISGSEDVKKTGVFQTTLSGLLEVAGRKIPVNAPAMLRYHAPGKGDEKNESLMVDLKFDLKAAELGLKTFGAAEVIHVRASVTAYSAEAAASKTRKK